MGGGVLRREILRRSRTLRVALLGLIAMGLWAQETNFPQIPHEQARTGERTDPSADGDTLQFSRPLRNMQENPITVNGENAPERPRSWMWHGSTEMMPVIEGVDRPLTQRYIAEYSSPEGLEWLKAVIRRGDPYVGFIRKELEKRGLPQELVYLPVLESAFLPTAVSRSGAVGLWQFMKNSIGPFGIRINEWMDERRDFWKTTTAALRKLQDNYEYFGDWDLALAAYNAGIGAVQRAVQKAGIKDYWVLCDKKLLKNETINYVPKFLAIATILSKAGRYGLDIGWPEDIQWKQVPVGKSVDLGLLAKNAGIDEGFLKMANRELYYNVTPPEPDYHLKVRSEDEQPVLSTLANRDLKLIRYYFYVIKSGDTLSTLARYYGVSVDQIVSANPGIQVRYLKLGSKIVIPALKDVEPYRGTPKATGSSNGPSLSFNGTHLVKKGETLWSIALAYGVDPELLAQENNMDLNSVLREGRILKTPINSGEVQ